MNRYYWTNATLLLGVMLCQQTLFAQEETAAKTNKSSASDVVLSEVCYWPKEGEPEWIELTNISDKAVDLKGWQLLDGQALDFVITEASFLLPPEGYMVVYLDGTGEPISLAKPESWAAHSPKGVAGNVLGDKGGQVALYLPTLAPYSPPEIRSYVAWGNSPGRILMEAMKKRLWMSNSDYILGTDLSLPIFGPARIIKQGGAIGLIKPVEERVNSENWGVLNPSDISLGESGVHRRRPVTYLPFGDKTNEEGNITLSAVPEGENTKYRFQVCSNQDCTEVFLDSIMGGPAYALEKPIPRNSTYFWRVQVIYPDNSTSQWSDTRSLTNGYPK